MTNIRYGSQTITSQWLMFSIQRTREVSCPCLFRIVVGSQIIPGFIITQSQYQIISYLSLDIYILLCGYFLSFCPNKQIGLQNIYYQLLRRCFFLNLILCSIELESDTWKSIFGWSSQIFPILYLYMYLYIYAFVFVFDTCI